MARLLAATVRTGFGRCGVRPISESPRCRSPSGHGDHRSRQDTQGQQGQGTVPDHLQSWPVGVCVAQAHSGRVAGGHA
eukprot:3923630-Pyramimonas_sp.AAC.1